MLADALRYSSRLVNSRFRVQIPPGLVAKDLAYAPALIYGYIYGNVTDFLSCPGYLNSPINIKSRIFLCKMWLHAAVFGNIETKTMT